MTNVEIMIENGKKLLAAGKLTADEIVTINDLSSLSKRDLRNLSKLEYQELRDISAKYVGTLLDEREIGSASHNSWHCDGGKTN